MAKVTESKLESAGGAPPPELLHSKKLYESPKLQEWGSIAELTGGDFQPPGDAEDGGSSPA